MENLIEKMLSNEFERLTTAELNRPLKEEILVVEEDRLVAVLYGMLRQRRYNFVELFKGNMYSTYILLTNTNTQFTLEEGLTAMKALIKQTIVEALAANDTDVERGSLLFDQLKHLNFASWTKFVEKCMASLIALLNRIRAIRDIMVNVVSTETGRQEEVILYDCR